MSDRLSDQDVGVHWSDVLKNAHDNSKTVSILVNGSYKPYTGKILRMELGLITLVNEYSMEYISMNEVKAVRVYV